MTEEALLLTPQHNFCGVSLGHKLHVVLLLVPLAFCLNQLIECEKPAGLDDMKDNTQSSGSFKKSLCVCLCGRGQLLHADQFITDKNLHFSIYMFDLFLIYFNPSAVLLVLKWYRMFSSSKITWCYFLCLKTKCNTSCSQTKLLIHNTFINHTITTHLVHSTHLKLHCAHFCVVW